MQSCGDFGSSDKNGAMSKKLLSASQEDYLEMIFFLSRASGLARPKEIAERMKVRAASVTGALRALAEKGMINYQPYGAVALHACRLSIRPPRARKPSV